MGNKLMPLFESTNTNRRINYIEQNFVDKKKSLQNFLVLGGSHQKLNYTELVFMVLSIFKWIFLLIVTGKGVYNKILGDVYVFYGGIRYYFVISSILASIESAYFMYLFGFDKNQNWRKIFECLEGLYPFKSIGIHNCESRRKLVRRAKLVSIAAKMMDYSFVLTSIPLPIFIVLSKIDYNMDSVSWCIGLIINTIWCYLMSWITIYPFSFFHVICYYCILRIKLNNDQLYSVLDSQEKVTQIFGQFLEEYNDIQKTVYDFNKFWKKYYLVSIFTLTPINVICIQQIFFAKLEKSILAIFVVVAYNTSIFIFLVNFISASVPYLMRKPHNKLAKLQSLNNFKSINLKIKVWK